MNKIQLLKFEGDVNGVEIVLFKQGDLYTVSHDIDPAVSASRGNREFNDRAEAYLYAKTLINEEIVGETEDGE